MIEVDKERVYEAYEHASETLKEYQKLFQSLKYFLSDEEIAEFKDFECRLVSDKLDLESVCERNNICTRCGGEIKRKIVHDEECGDYTKSWCGECHMNYD